MDTSHMARYVRERARNMLVPPMPPFSMAERMPMPSSATDI
jgi:hypothetical protein